ncbi:MAG: DUF6036 family nucleotidyltransferase [Oligoflexia bacterium]|nr:DUF6036 family nucleotidyltransferase [Oligoflexia bacterium]
MLNSKRSILTALKKLDQLAPRPFEMIVGGGAAMICAYESPLSTVDIDAVLKPVSINEIKPAVQKIAKDLNLPVDWLNTWYSSFTHNLPQDFRDRLHFIFKGKKIKAYALGAEDLLILKCCAHRTKDIGHARILIRKKANPVFVRNHLEKLMKKKLLQNNKAIEFLNDILDLEGIED